MFTKSNTRNNFSKDVQNLLIKKQLPVESYFLSNGLPLETLECAHLATLPGERHGQGGCCRPPNWGPILGGQCRREEASESLGRTGKISVGTK